MSKSEKKNGKHSKKKKQKQKLKTAKTDSGALLIALEGTRGAELEEATPRLARQYDRGEDGAAWSRFDASNTFYELRMGKARNLTPTPRTLVLLYASDLLFRLRWEIQPALKEGRTVVAAPYVESAIGFGIAAGLSKEWLKELFTFAPVPDARFRLKEKKKAKEKKKREKTAAGFVEFCSSSLAATSPDWDPAELRAGVLKYLDELEESDEIRKFGRKKA